MLNKFYWQKYSLPTYHLDFLRPNLLTSLYPVVLPFLEVFKCIIEQSTVPSLMLKIYTIHCDVHITRGSNEIGLGINSYDNLFKNVSGRK